MRHRGWVLLLLVMHLVVHPMTHALSVGSDHGQPHSISTSSQSDLGTIQPLDNCDLCRVGQNATITPDATRVELLTPQWIPVRLHSVSYESLQIAPILPSRAPPTL